jgi:hypothetical protein
MNVLQHFFCAIWVCMSSFSSLSYALQLKVNILVVGIDLQLQLQRSSLRTDVFSKFRSLWQMAKLAREAKASALRAFGCRPVFMALGNSKPPVLPLKTPRGGAGDLKTRLGKKMYAIATEGASGVL